MSKVRIESRCALYDGMSITFNAPCDSDAVDGINVYYNDEATTFSLRDAHGNDLSEQSDLFTTGAYVKAVLDTTKNYAYLQNADTNAYLEKELGRSVLTAETAAKYGLEGDNATVNNALDALASTMIGQGLTTLTVLDPDGTPLSGIAISGVTGVGGTTVSTDSSGIAKVVVTANVTATLSHPEYADLPAYDVALTPNYEEINYITVTMPYASSGTYVSFTASGSVKFKKARTVTVALVGGGNGGASGYGGEKYTASSEGYAGPGGAGGAGGKVYNASVSVAADTEYTFAMGAGGSGGSSGYDSTAGSSGGATTGFGLSSASGSSSNLVFNDSSIMAGGNGGRGGEGYSPTGGTGSGSAGTRCGGKGGSGGTSTGYSGSAGSIPGGGGGGGGGGGRASTYTRGGAGGSGAAGGVFIKF